jgi:hypothetical protein
MSLSDLGEEKAVRSCEDSKEIMVHKMWGVT